jgi:hypothetical protein
MAVVKPEFVTPPENRTRGVVKVTSMKARGAVSQPEGRWTTKTAARPFLLEHDILKVTNQDDVEWEFRWDRRKYMVKPGETGYVPFPAVCIKMGDPRSAPDTVTRFNTEDGQRGIVATRHDVLCSLFAHYGIGNEDVNALVDWGPKLEVRTMEDDLEVQFPIQNPDMAPWPVPTAPQPGRENSDTRRMVGALEDENRAMRAELDEMRSMLTERLSPPVGHADPQIAQQGRPLAADPMYGDDSPDDLAAALSGATIDQGPASAIR